MCTSEMIKVSLPMAKRVSDLTREQEFRRDLAELFHQPRPELSPSFLIGGVAENFGTSFMVRTGTKPFILEGDE